MPRSKAVQMLASAFGNEVFWNRPGEWRAVRALVLHHARRYIWMYVGLFLFLSFGGFVTYPARLSGSNVGLVAWALFPVIFAVRNRTNGTTKTLLGLSFTRTAVASSIWLSSVLLSPVLFAVAESLGILVWVWGGPAAPIELLAILPNAFVASACCALFLMFFAAIPDPRLALSDSCANKPRYIGRLLVAYLLPVAVGATAMYVNHFFVKQKALFGILEPLWMLPVFGLEIVLSLAVMFLSALFSITRLLEAPPAPRGSAAGPSRVREALPFRERPGKRFAPLRFLRESLHRSEMATWTIITICLLLPILRLGFTSTTSAEYLRACVNVGLLVLTVIVTGQVAKWLASLRCLRALPWTPNRLAWFIFCGPLVIFLAVLAGGFVSLAVFGSSPAIGWMALVLSAPLFGLLLTPRTGVGLFIAVFAISIGLVLVLVAGESVMLWLLVPSIALLMASAYRLRRLIDSPILYRERAMEFLVPGQRR